MLTAELKLLALDASVEPGSCALLCRGALSVRYAPAQITSSQALLPMAGELLAEAGIAWADLDAIGFACGPGSFTGLRVACSIAQGLAFAHDLPVVPVDSLATVAEQAFAAHPEAQAVFVLMDARMGEVYSAQYQRQGGGLLRCDAPVVLPPASVLLPEHPDTLCAGNALTAYPLLAERFAAASFAMRPDLLPEAGAVARLAAQRFMAEGGVSAEEAIPTYVRDKVALTVAERLAQGGRA